jgi:hypothetical protein
MLDEIKDLLEGLIARPPALDRTDGAYLGLLLESQARASTLIGIDQNYKLLPPHLRGIALSADDCDEIVQRICEFMPAAGNRQRRTLFWTLSMADRDIGFAPLISVLGKVADSLDAEASLQAVFALDSHLFHDYDGSLLAKNAELLRAHRVADFLMKVDTRNANQKMMVHKILEKIRRLDPSNAP